uniref:Leucine-rich repeat-containing N-terminal plant-type domain-containing protein n=1 Tax=Leersia perrieri TaxID=77586 RepID=A0A0D9VXS1_9ORYZ
MGKLTMSLLPIVVIFLLQCASGLTAVETDAADADYMHRLAAATGAELLLGWKANSDPCNDNWIGVSCDTYNSRNKIFQIDVRGLLAGGTLPEFDQQIGSLSQLERLDLGFNNLTGPVPAFILDRLRRLLLDGNVFSQLPHEFFRGMPQLQYFSIDDNPMLEEWGLGSDVLSLSKLTVCNASNANINGTLQVLLSNSSAFLGLAQVSFANNRLTGVVPETFITQTITKLDLRNNRLAGSINFINNFQLSIIELRLDYNHFSGPFPTDLSGFNVLSVITVAHNRLTGVVPPSLAQLSYLSWVSVSDNLLQGPLPELPSSVKTDFDVAAIRGIFCRLDGHGPCSEETGVLLSIAAAFHYPEILAMSWRRNDPCDGWLGIHCGGAGQRRVTGVNLSRFGLNGTIDQAFASLLSLEVIILSGNNISGTIPPSVAQMPSLRVLDVSNNALEGTVLRIRDDALIWVEGNNHLNVTISGTSLLEGTTPFLVFVAVIVSVFGW